MRSNTKRIRAVHGAMPKRWPRPVHTPPKIRPSRGRTRPWWAKLWRISLMVDALPSGWCPGVCLTPLFCAARDSRHIGCTPDPTLGNTGELDVAVLGDSAEHRESLCRGEVEAFHQDAPGSADFGADVDRGFQV